MTKKSINGLNKQHMRILNYVCENRIPIKGIYRTGITRERLLEARINSYGGIAKRLQEKGIKPPGMRFGYKEEAYYVKV